MAVTIGLTEAKAKLSELLDRVSAGEEFVITRHDQMVARLVPIKGTTREEVKQTVDKLKEISKTSRITLDEITAWKNEGRS